MNCPVCNSVALSVESVDLIYMVVDVVCLECHSMFKLRIDDDAFDVEEAKQKP